MPAGSRAYYDLSYLENPRRAIEPFFLSLIPSLFFSLLLGRKVSREFPRDDDLSRIPRTQQRNNEESPLPLSTAFAKDSVVRGQRHGIGKRSEDYEKCFVSFCNRSWNRYEYQNYAEQIARILSVRPSSR